MPFVLSLSLLACGSPEPPPFQTTEPVTEVAHSNVLIVLLDDVATDKVGVYAEHPHPARTPVIDHLASQGMRFTRAYAYSTCSPTRAALLTGRHGRRTGVGYNIRDRGNYTLPQREALLPEMLATASPPYHSAMIGKWHLQPRKKQTVQNVKRQGFEYYAGALSNLYRGSTYQDYTWFTDDGQAHEHEHTYLTTREIDEAIQLVDTLEEPWLVYLAVHAPHYPWTPPPDALVQQNVGPDAGDAAIYDVMLEAVDTELGRLLGHVDLQDTLVMVIGDNGDPDEVVRPPSSNKEAKNTMFEGGIRVPWIAAGPGIAAGVVNEEMIHVVDVFPTLAAAAGVDPARPGVPIDGQSLWPALLGQQHTPRDHIFVEKYFSHTREASWQALRDERYKIIKNNRKFEGFYDLSGRVNDGPNLLDAPLTEEQQRAYEALTEELGAINTGLGKSPRDKGAGGCL